MDDLEKAKQEILGDTKINRIFVKYRAGDISQNDMEMDICNLLSKKVEDALKKGMEIGTERQFQRDKPKVEHRIKEIRAEERQKIEKNFSKFKEELIDEWEKTWRKKIEKELIAKIEKPQFRLTHEDMIRVRELPKVRAGDIWIRSKDWEALKKELGDK